MTHTALQNRQKSLQQAAQGYLEEGALADAIVALEFSLTSSDALDPAALALCERAGVDPKDTTAVQELLTALSSRLAQMTDGRSSVFSNALEAYPPDRRFSLPALAEALWPALENLRRAGGADAAAYRREIARFEPQLRALYRQASGRGEGAWEATWASLTTRLPGIFARYAAVLGPDQDGAFKQLLRSPEGVGVLMGAMGLVTIRMPVSTPLICGTLALVGYAGVSPLLDRLRGHLRRTVLAALSAEDDAVARLGEDHNPLTLTEVATDVRPVLVSAVLSGEENPTALLEHARPWLARMRRTAMQPGGPGEAYANAVEDVVRTKYIPQLCRIAVSLRAAAEASSVRRALRDPRGAGLAAATVTLPVSYAVARVTPWGIWDMPLMVALFFFAGMGVTRVLRNPEGDLLQLHDAMAQEERLLAGLFNPTTPSPP